MEDGGELFALASGIAVDFLRSLPERRVYPEATREELLGALGGPLPEEGLDAAAVISDLAAAADRGLVASAGGRYFGFVTGSSLPAAVAADWLTSTWDQNTAMFVMSPAAVTVEEVAAGWLRELLGIGPAASFAFVTGAQMANFTALAAARHHVLAAAGWDVERHGLTGAPAVRVVVGANRHSTIDGALRMLGLGAPTVVVPADDQGRLRVDALDLDDRPTIVCAQAGEVNTGAFDPFGAIADARDAAANAWLHVDGAFGLWAAASPGRRHLVAGASRADSWSTDAHKWLNVPYDCGLVFTRHPESHQAAFSVRAAYLPPSDHRDPIDWSPEASRRARAFTVYAALRTLGRTGVADLVERTCELARRIADGLRELGADVLNEVELNQVLVRFGGDAETQRVLAAVQASGETWMGGTVWDGRPAIRVSVSSWRSAVEDADRVVAAFARASRAA